MRNEELGEAPRGRLCGLGKREARRGRELRDSMPLHLLITYYKTVGAGLSRDPRKLTLFPRITPTTSQLSYRKIPHSSFFIPHWRPWAPTPLCAFVPLCLLPIPNWRRERDSNPRYLAVQRFSRPPHSTTLPSLLLGGTGMSPPFFVFLAILAREKARRGGEKDLAKSAERRKGGEARGARQ